MDAKPELYIIAGPTATGKSGLAVELARLIGGEVVSADSAQVYRGMDIGTAKITAAEMKGVAHHLIDVMDIDEEYSAVCFKRMAREALGEIYGRGHIPIICGGTGFYIQALLYDIEFEGEENTDAPGMSYREYLEGIRKEKGAGYLVGMLRGLDPYTCETLDLSNSRKVVRALEFLHLHGYSFRKHNEEQTARRESPSYDCRFFVLSGERQALYRRIERRVDRMLADGLVDEVKSLRERGLKRGSVPGQAIGYKEILAFLDGECTLEEAAERIRINTRHFAKRQLTWFRREKNAVWINIDEGNTLDAVRKYLQ